MTPCKLIDVQRHFGGTYSLIFSSPLQPWRQRQHFFSETSVKIHRTTWRHIPEEGNLHSHWWDCCNSHKYFISSFLFLMCNSLEDTYPLMDNWACKVFFISSFKWCLLVCGELGSRAVRFIATHAQTHSMCQFKYIFCSAELAAPSGMEPCSYFGLAEPLQGVDRRHGRFKGSSVSTLHNQWVMPTLPVYGEPPVIVSRIFHNK